MMGHAFCPQELEDVHKWLLQVVPRNDSMAELPPWMETVVKHVTLGYEPSHVKHSTLPCARDAAATERQVKADLCLHCF